MKDIRSKLAVLSICAITAMSMPMGIAYANFAGGSGTADDPYIIGTAEQLAAFAAAVDEGTSYSEQYVELGADIDLGGIESWNPIGDEGKAPTGKMFAGSFDGKGYTISNLKINGSYTSEANVGLFSTIDNTATVKNVIVKDASINVAETGSWSAIRAGAVIGDTARKSGSRGAIVDNCYSSGSVSASNVDGSTFVGGIAGRLFTYSALINCVSEADAAAVSAGGWNAAYAGGIVGMSGNNTVIANCAAFGNTSATNTADDTDAYAGGIAGMISSKTYNCYATGDAAIARETTADEGYVGIVSGYLSASANAGSYNYFASDAKISIAAADGMATTPGTVAWFENNAKDANIDDAVSSTKAEMAAADFADTLNGNIEAVTTALNESALALNNWVLSDGRVVVEMPEPVSNVVTDTLPNAVNGVIKLSNNVELAASAEIKTDTVIDLNGYTISKEKGAAIVFARSTPNVTLTVVDSSSAQTGAIKASGDQSSAVVVYGGGTTFNLNGGNIAADGQDSHGIFMYPQNPNVTVNVNGGTINVTGTGACGILAQDQYDGDNTTVNVNGGTITASAGTGTGAYGVLLQGADETLNVKGGIIKADGARSYAVSTLETGMTGHTVNVSGGTLIADGTNSECIDLEMDNTAIITGGRLESSSSSIAAISIRSGNTLKISGGEIAAKTNAVMSLIRNNNTISISGDAIVKGANAVYFSASGNDYRSKSNPALVTISGGYINGKLYVPSGYNWDDPDPYTIYNITGGYFTDAIADSAFYNYDLSVGKTAEEYETVKADETKALLTGSNTDKNGDVYGYVIGDKPTETANAAEKVESEDIKDGSMAFKSVTSVSGSVDLTDSVWRIYNKEGKSVDISANFDGTTVTNGTITVGLVLTATAIADNEIDTAVFVY